MKRSRISFRTLKKFYRDKAQSWISRSDGVLILGIGFSLLLVAELSENVVENAGLSGPCRRFAGRVRDENRTSALGEVVDVIGIVVNEQKVAHKV